MRRRSENHLVPNEERTLAAALALHLAGTQHFHGYLLAGLVLLAYSVGTLLIAGWLFRRRDID